MKLTKTVQYRVEQFLRALTAQHTVSEKSVKRAARILSPEARALFIQQAPQDQRHALSVYETLLERGHSNRDLLVAALLHDVGKAASPASPLQRGFFVLAERFAPRALDRLVSAMAGDEEGPLVAYANHAEIGARRAEEAGCSPLTVELIRHHERPLEACRTERDHLLAALQAADNVN